MSTINTFPDQPTNIHFLIHSVTTSLAKPDELVIDSNYNPNVIFIPLGLEPSSFIPTLPNSYTKLEHICAYLHSTNSNSTNFLDLPVISLSPLNEYNMKRFFNVSFPTLFATGISMISQPIIIKFEMYEYDSHLMTYHDN